MENLYQVKRIEFFQRNLSILTQSNNGPCPLLAIANTLIIKGLLSVHSDYSAIDHNELVGWVAEIMLEQLKFNHDANWGYRANDAINILPRLAVGLDVNVKFLGFNQFEFTAECDVFELLGIRLVHGWVVENNEEKTAIEELTYNQAVELIMTQPGDRADLISRFFNENPSQLTSKGLRMIENGLDEEEVAVFFRNNHFSTIIKLNGSVYLLATDVAFIEAENVVWERLEQIKGNNLFCNSFFIPLEPTENVLYESKRFSQSFEDKKVSQSFEEVKRTSAVRKFGGQNVLPNMTESPKVEVVANENKGKNDKNREVEGINEKAKGEIKSEKKEKESVDFENKEENGRGESLEEQNKGKKGVIESKMEEFKEAKSEPGEQQAGSKGNPKKSKKEGCCLIF